MASAPRGESREKVIERANAFAQRGAFGRAIATLEEHLAGHPDDDRMLVRLADLRRRSNDDAGAAAAFSKAAALYDARGFHAKVAAVLQQALALTPDDLALVERLAQTKVELALPREATQLLERIVEAAQRAGDRPRVLALRRRIHALLPADAATTVRLADALVEAGQRDEAIALLDAAVDTAGEPAQRDLWLVLQERLADLRPPAPALARELGRAHLARRAPKRALARLKGCATADPDDVEALTLLAQAFDALGQGDKVVAAWREIAKAHHRAQRAVESQQAWLHVRELAPADPEAAAALPRPELPPRGPTATLQEDLAEADFLAAQGVTDEARAILERLRGLYPGEAGIAERLEELDIEKVSVSELIPDEEELVADGAERTSTTDILQRVALEHVPALSEAQTYRDLAAAYVEIEEYAAALVEVERALEIDEASAGASHLLAARAHLASGAPRLAVEAYRRAMTAPGFPAEEAADVLCELGHSHELLGERDEAARCFTEAKKLEPALDGEAELLGAGA